MGTETAQWGTPFNVVAAFRRKGQAEAARRLLVDNGIPPAAVSIEEQRGVSADGPAEIASMRAEMQNELNRAWPGWSAFMSGSMARGAFWGMVVFSAAGLVAGLLGGLIWIAAFDGILAPGWRLLVAAAIGALAGGTIGVLAGGGFEPRLDAAADPGAEMDDPRPAAERDVMVAIHSDRQEVAEAAADLLVGFGAERVDRADASGTPLPPQADMPRPADPPGWWWRRAGHG